MRRLILVALMLWGPFVQAQQSDKKAVDSFKAMVTAASSVTLYTEVYLNDHLKGWTKSYLQISNIKYDVKKTDSAINPLIGVASFTATTKISPPYPSKGEAANSTDFRKEALTRDFSITYQLDGRKWKAVNVKYDSTLLGMSPPARPMRGMDYKPKPKNEMGQLDKALTKWLPGIY